MRAISVDVSTGNGACDPAGSENILAAPDLGEGRDGIAYGAHRRLQRRLIGAQERIGGELLAHRRGHGRLVARTQLIDPTRAGKESIVARLDRQREARVRLRVLVTAIDPRLRPPR